MFYGHWTEMGLIYFYLAMLSLLSHHFCLFRGFLVYLLSIPKSSPALDNFIFFYKYRISGENLKLLFRYVQMYVFFFMLHTISHLLASPWIFIYGNFDVLSGHAPIFPVELTYLVELASIWQFCRCKEVECKWLYEYLFAIRLHWSGCVAILVALIIESITN